MQQANNVNPNTNHNTNAQNIVHNFEQAFVSSQQAMTWVERNAPKAQDLALIKNELVLDLARSAQKVNCSIDNLKHRPTIGLFGASQAGKSYLVSSLAAGVNGSLQTNWDGVAIDFIKHVNPSGNNSEATGFVTRFTHSAPQLVPNFPVKLKVLTELELVKILVNAFFSDINQSDVKVESNEDVYLAHLAQCESFVDKEAQQAFLSYESALALEQNNATNLNQEIRDTLKNKQVRYQNQLEYNYIDFIDVVELADYIAQNSNGKLGSFEQMPRFWHKLRSMLPFMPLQGRVRALSILWQDLAIFNETYRHLAQELLKLEGQVQVFAEANAFVTLNEQSQSLEQNASGTIMHITKLATMFADASSIKCKIFTKNQENTQTLGHERAKFSSLDKEVLINTSCLAALALELEFYLEEDGILPQYDVLDMPGARSRDVVQLKDVIDDSANFDGKTISSAMQLRGSEFFRRGKVAYLFDRYAKRNEIEQLLFCIGVNAQQDVTSVLTILSQWVDDNVGSTPAKRATGYNPLTIVLTRYDEVFNRQLRNIENSLPLDMNQELNIAFNRIQKLNWFNEWTPGTPFKRVFLARKPNLGDLNPWIDSDEQRRELGINALHSANIEKIKHMLMGVADFSQHIEDIGQALDAVLSLNDGGINNIAQAIIQNSLNDVARLSVKTYRASMSLHNCAQELSIFAKRDGALALQKATKESKALSLGLMQCNYIAPCFYRLRNLLEINKQDLEEIYQQGFAIGSNVQRFVRSVMQFYLNNLSELCRKDNLELNAIADYVVSKYQEALPNFSANLQSAQYFSFFYDESESRFKTAQELKDDILALFVRLFNEIAKTFSSPQIGLKDYMCKVLLEKENVNEGFDDILNVQVQLMDLMLSDFNLYLGVNLIPNAQELASAQAQIATMPLNIQVNTYPNSQSQNNLNMTSSTSASVTGINLAQASSNKEQGNTASSFGDDEDFDFSDFDDFADVDDSNGYAKVEDNKLVADANRINGSNNANSATTFTQNKFDMHTSHMLDMQHNNVAKALDYQNMQGVLNSKEGPVNSFSYSHEGIIFDERKQDYTVFSNQVDRDESGLLPKLNAKTNHYEFKLISDYCATLMYMMCKVNVLVESKYQFPAEENLMLCQILDNLENCE